MNDVLLNKRVSIERCVQQVNRYYHMETGLPFADDRLRQDAVAMNLPRDSRESFFLLEQAGLIDTEMMRKLQGMIGFRNILVHEYQKMDMAIMVEVIEHHSQDLLAFTTHALTMADQT